MFIKLIRDIIQTETSDPRIFQNREYNLDPKYPHIYVDYPWDSDSTILPWSEFYSRIREIGECIRPILLKIETPVIIERMWIPFCKGTRRRYVLGNVEECCIFEQPDYITWMVNRGNRGGTIGIRKLKKAPGNIW